MLNFRCSDPHRERTESAVRGRVAVTADNRHARERRALFRSDHVNNALAAGKEREESRRRILFQVIDQGRHLKL